MLIFFFSLAAVLAVVRGQSIRTVNDLAELGDKQANTTFRLSKTLVLPPNTMTTVSGLPGMVIDCQARPCFTTGGANANLDIRDVAVTSFTFLLVQSTAARSQNSSECQIFVCDCCGCPTAC